MKKTAPRKRQRPIPTMAWHYTVGVWIKPILNEGIIKQATARVPNHVRPAAWFTTSPIWEQTANTNGQNPETGEVVFLNARQTSEAYGGLWRIGPHTWDDYVTSSNENLQDIKGMEAWANRKGSDYHRDFRCSFKSVSREHWTVIEWYDWNRGAWRDIGEHEPFREET